MYTSIPRLSLLFGVISAPISLLYANPSWELVGGKKDIVVNTMIVRSFSSGRYEDILIGTEKGLFRYYTEESYYSGFWEPFIRDIAVHDIKITSSGKMLLAAGNGSDTDGVYQTGTHSYLQLLVKCPRPTTVAFAKLFEIYAGTLYAGCDSTVYAGNMHDNAILKMTPIPENPALSGKIIKSLLYSDAHEILYIACSSKTQNASTPEYNTSRLTTLTGIEPSLHPIVKINASSLSELTLLKRYNPDVKDKGEIDSVIAAPSGGNIIFIDKGLPVDSLPVPVAGEPVLAVVPYYRRAEWSMHYPDWYASIAAVTPSGIFVNHGPLHDSTWHKLDTVPNRMRCVAHLKGSNTFWTGTDSGVYRYEPGLPSAVNNCLALCKTRFISLKVNRYGNVHIQTEKHLPPDISLNIHTLNGRLVYNCCVTAQSMTDVHLSRGLYCYRVGSGNRNIISGTLVVDRN